MITTGEATLRLLARYGVDTVFGIPGVHTLDFCRGLGTGAIRHVQTRHEQGAAMMADGMARATGRPGVALVISGPGVTNAVTALGQAFADSVPLLLISAEAASDTLGKGRGVLHEVSDLTALTRPVTGLSACARRAEDVPELLAEAFGMFAAGRPRPAHIAIPIDVLAQMTVGDWPAVTLPSRPVAGPDAIARAAALLRNAERPVIAVGAGAAGAGALASLAERLDAPVLGSLAGKGILPGGHPLDLGGAICREAGRAVLFGADVVLAIGTELSEVDSYVGRHDLTGRLIRIDIDPRQMGGLYPADVPVPGDAAAAVGALVSALGDTLPAAAQRRDGAARVAEARAAITASLSGAEPQHLRMLEVLRQTLPGDAIVFGDSCQPVYTGGFAFPVQGPRQWHPAGGYCTLGNALPGAIGAKIALPNRAVAAIAGDGGLMFTVQELLTGAEQGLPLPVIVWDNKGFQQIRDDMRAGNVPRVGVDGMGPDWPALCRAMHCHHAAPDSAAGFAAAVSAALTADRPTLIIVSEGDRWLC